MSSLSRVELGDVRTGMARSVLLAGVELGGIDGFIWTGLGEPLDGRRASQWLGNLLVWVELRGVGMEVVLPHWVGCIIAWGFSVTDRAGGALFGC